MDLNAITIRTDLRAGDLGYVVYRHGILYSREYDYGVSFEMYVAEGVSRNYRASYLWTTNELDAAASLYMRHGFQLTVEKESTAFGKPLLEQRYDLMMGD